jgi:hypothetical protein
VQRSVFFFFFFFAWTLQWLSVVRICIISHNRRWLGMGKLRYVYCSQLSSSHSAVQWPRCRNQHRWNWTWKWKWKWGLDKRSLSGFAMSSQSELRLLRYCRPLLEKTRRCECLFSFYFPFGVLTVLSVLVFAAGGLGFLASAMLETDKLDTNYPYGDNKSGDSFNAGITKQNWYMARLSWPAWNRLGSGDYNIMAQMNANLTLDAAVYASSMKYFGQQRCVAWVVCRFCSNCLSKKIFCRT